MPESSPSRDGSQGIDDILVRLNPVLLDGEFVFCSFPGAAYGDHANFAPFASFAELEGLSLVIPRAVAEREGIGFSEPYRAISLQAYTSLTAVGVTAAITTELARRNVSANVVAAFYHDHVFVPAHCADQALAAIVAVQRAAATRSGAPPSGQRGSRAAPESDTPTDP